MQFIKEARLVGEQSGKIREMRGFLSFHREPELHNAQSRQFISLLGSQEVKELAMLFFDKIRIALDYKRREIHLACDGASATLKTPDFEVNMGLAQHPKDPVLYQLTMEVGRFRHPHLLENEALLALFSTDCNYVVFDLEGRLDIESKIDEIEAVDSLRPLLDYSAGCRDFTVRLEDLGVHLHVAPSRIRFSLPGAGDLKMLLEKTRAAFRRLEGSNITLGLSADSTPG